METIEEEKNVDNTSESLPYYRISETFESNGTKTYFVYFLSRDYEDFKIPEISLQTLAAIKRSQFYGISDYEICIEFDKKIVQVIAKKYN